MCAELVCASWDLLNDLVNRNAKVYAPVNIDRIQHWIDQGRLTSSAENPITARELLLSGCVHDVHDGIKLLGDVRFLQTSLEHTTDVCAGFRTSEDSHPHHTIKGIKICHSYRRETGWHSLLQILQSSRSSRLRQGTGRQTAGCACQADRHRYAHPPCGPCSYPHPFAVWYTQWKNRGYLSPQALEKMPVVEERWKELSKQLRVYREQGYEKAKK